MMPAVAQAAMTGSAARAPFSNSFPIRPGDILVELRKKLMTNAVPMP
jgi:hypothetical protein